MTNNHNEKTNLIKSIDDLIDSFLPIDIETPVNVIASLRDFRSSRRCFGEEIKK